MLVKRFRDSFSGASVAGCTLLLDGFPFSDFNQLLPDVIVLFLELFECILGYNLSPMMIDKLPHFVLTRL